MNMLFLINLLQHRYAYLYLPLSHLFVLVSMECVSARCRSMECVSARLDIYFVEHIVHVFNLMLSEFPMNMIVTLFHH
jgi:hypothetical protein